MALVLADRVQEYSTTTGTGTLTLSGAYAGFQTFAAGIGNGNTCYYTITSDTNQWEVGIGTVGVGTLARTTLISSSTGSLVSFVGTLTVFVTYPAEKAVYSDSTTIVAPAGALLPITSGGTGASTAAGARTALGLGTMSTQDANAVAVTGGTINGTTVGATTVAAGSFSTLNSSGNTRLGGLSGNQSLQVNNVASAVNYAQVIGATTGGYPAFQAQGTDANVGFLFDAKGGGISYFRAQSSTVQFAVGTAASSVNYILAFGGATGAYPTLSATGSDANIGFVFNAKGTAAVAFQTSSTLQAQVSHTAAAVNYLNLTGAATGAAPTLSAQGSDATIALNLTSKSFGAVNINTGTGIVAKFIDRGTATVDSPFIFRSGLAGIQGGALTFPVAPRLQTVDAAGIEFATAAGSTGAPGGVVQVSISHTASAVNYVNLTGAATGAAPTISAQGSDANIGLVLSSKGTGVVALGGSTVANSALQVKPTVSSVNYIQVNGNTAGNGVNLQAEGSDADVALSIRAKGTFNIPFFTGGGTQFLISHTGSAVNYVRATGAATTGAPELSAQGSDANINLKLTPKGTGVLQFGTYTAGVVAQAGYITITDAGGTSRRLLVG